MPRSYGVVLLVALTVWALLGILAGQALGNHVQCGDVITQDTTLDSDLVDCPADGIVIGADGITIDLSGHTVDGDGVEGEAEEDPTDYGVDNTAGRDRVTIRNGTVQEFYTGITAGIVTGNRVRHLKLARNWDGIWLGGSQNTLEQNSIVDSFSAIVLRGDANVIRHNSLARNMSGISVSSGQGNVVEANSLVDSRLSPDGGGRSGIALYFADRNRIERNYVAGTEYPFPYGYSAGIRLLASSHNMIRRNRSVDNGFGIILSCYGRQGSSNNVIEKNSAGRNRVDGIVISYDLGAGVCRFGPQGGFDSPSRDNLIAQNKLDRNLSDGLYIEKGDAGTLVERNTANGNGDDGIDTNEPATTLTGNRARQNGGFGIEAVVGIVDGGANRAVRNGDPLQCLNVICR